MSSLNYDLHQSEDDDEENPHMYGFVDKHMLKDKNKPNSITIKMIMERNLKKTVRPNTTSDPIGNTEELSDVDEYVDTSKNKKARDYEDIAELKANQLLKLTHVHLDRENIGEIDNLAEYLGDVTHLYLQHNLIDKIENLEFLHK